MSAPKPGDRVRVEYEAEVVRLLEDGELCVQEMGSISFEEVNPDWCTVIAPPVKAGDILTYRNIAQLKPGAIVAVSPDGLPCWFDGLGTWHFATGSEVTSDQLLHRRGSFEILRIGRSEQ